MYQCCTTHSWPARGVVKAARRINPGHAGRLHAGDGRLHPYSLQTGQMSVFAQESMRESATSLPTSSCAVTTRASVLNERNAAASTSGWKTATRRSCARGNACAYLGFSYHAINAVKAEGRHWRRHFRLRRQRPNRTSKPPTGAGRLTRSACVPFSV